MNLPAPDANVAQKHTFYQTCRANVVTLLVKQHDVRKILTFLNKCCILSIDTEEQVVFVGVPNDFILWQVKKFFDKDIRQALHEVLNDQYTYRATVDPTLWHTPHPHSIDLKKLFTTSTVTWSSGDKRTSSAGASSNSGRRPQWSASPTSNVAGRSPSHKKNFTSRRLDPDTKSTLTDFFGILFETKYTFEKLIVGSHNQLAHAAWRAVAEQPGEAYNPLFIYGDVWLGKTHLMQAIGNYSIAHRPDDCVVYLPTTKFIDLVIQSIKQNRLTEFMEKFEHVRIIMLDDIQFLAKKDKTQEIFHNIFNEFIAHKKQIVLTSDRPPKELKLLEPRLQSRFSLGLVVDIKAPDHETRLAILDAKLKAKGEKWDMNILDIIASHITSNVRELEGTINILLMQQAIHGQDITAEHVTEAIATLGYTPWDAWSQHTSPTQDRPQTSSWSSQHTNNTQGNQHAQLMQVLHAAAAFYHVSVDDVLGTWRTKQVSHVRQLCMRIAKHHFHRTFERIGSFFNGKNHSSVIYNINTYEKKHDVGSAAHQKLIKQLLAA